MCYTFLISVKLRYIYIYIYIYIHLFCFLESQLLNINQHTTEIFTTQGNIGKQAVNSLLRLLKELLM